MKTQTHFLTGMLDTLIERGRKIGNSVAWPSGDSSASDPLTQIVRWSHKLLAGRGEASGLAIANQILQCYTALSAEQRRGYFTALKAEFDPDWAALGAALTPFDGQTPPSPEAFRVLNKAVEPPRQELFRRINFATGGTAALVDMRADLLKYIPQAPELQAVDDDLAHLLQSWFNRGFLIIQPIDWSTAADTLEKIIQYEAVHQINTWDELKARLQPKDRRCYAFFHPAMGNEPLIFIEVALTADMPSSIQAILDPQRTALAADEISTAVFYSISNCQAGLKGISFGNFLIKQVVEELVRELPKIKNFVTLSPVPSFRRWLEKQRTAPAPNVLSNDDVSALNALDAAGWQKAEMNQPAARQLLDRLIHSYYFPTKPDTKYPVDPVARFHLGNGARLERICWLGDTSAKGIKEGAGYMVNYLYDLKSIEANHEAYMNTGKVASSRALQAAVKAQKGRKESI